MVALLLFLGEGFEHFSGIRVTIPTLTRSFESFTSGSAFDVGWFLISFGSLMYKKLFLQHSALLFCLLVHAAIVEIPDYSGCFPIMQ